MKEAADILKEIPHEYPFVMVDRVTELVPGRRAVAVKNITKDTLFSGKRTGLTSPEVLLLEAMAQVGALAAAGANAGADGGASKSRGAGGDPADKEPGYLAGLNDVEFRMRPRVGDRVVMTLEFVAGMGALVRFRGKAEIDGEIAVESGMTFTVPGGNAKDI